MHTVSTTTIPRKYHEAVEKWRDTFLPDYNLLLDNWERFFPRDPQFKLCAYRQNCACNEIEVGTDKGKPKFCAAKDMDEQRAAHILKAIKAQASTEFGSIQQHQLSLTRAQSEQDQFWILRMMAEELRHGYQMFHLLLEDDWGSVFTQSGEDMVEEILSMRTGSHVLGAFNIHFDSFCDNVVFCALIDRVGKYQLSMQKISAFKPMAESMPPMLIEEAFHLAAGVVPLRRWVTSAAKGDVYITMEMLQKVLYKWIPRGLDMFGDERGGGTNVKFGFKPMKNDESMGQYYDEVSDLVMDLNKRYIRTRTPKIDRKEAALVARKIMDEGESVHGISRDELLKMPAKSFFRRRGVNGYLQTDVEGNPIADFDQFSKHITSVLPESYSASIDFKDYLDLMNGICQGEKTIEDALMTLPTLGRVGGVCPCSKAVRWVMPEKRNGSNGNRTAEGNGDGSYG